jgi:bifunctional DNA-binding transcriptional regulator/antitoxin component of YhaV-PrlF toxin-antitoxin module
MKRHAGIVIVAAALGLALPLEAVAQEGTVRGKFVRLTEKKVGEREYVGVVIAPGEGKDEVVVLMGRDSKVLPAARGIRQGQQVEVSYVTERGQKWVKRIGAKAGDRPKVRDGGLVGKFVRLDEKTVGEKEYIAVVVQTAGADAATVLLTGRGTDAAARARKLSKGQQVEISYVTEGGQKWIRRIGAQAEGGQVRGKFVRLTERKVGEREHLVLVVQPDKGKDEVVLLMGRRSEAAARAKKLSKGQQVEVSYVTERDQKWIKRIEAAGAKDERLSKEVQAEIRALRTRLAKMEKELDALRAENARLKKQLREKKEPATSEDAPR